MKNGFVLLVITIFLIDFQGLYAQMETPKGKVEVVAVKGKECLKGKY
jgi:hypothetical protein